MLQGPRCTKASIAFLGTWRLKGGGDDLFISRNRFHLSCSASYNVNTMSSLNFFKLCKILADSLLASSIKCPRENCSNTLTWTGRTSSRCSARCSRRKCNGMASMRQNSRFSGSRLSIEKVLALTYSWAHKFTTTQADLTRLRINVNRNGDRLV